MRMRMATTVKLLATAAVLLLLGFSGCRSRDALLTQAQSAWDQEDWKTAVAKYEEFLKDTPPPDQAAEVHFKAGNVYYLNLKQFDRAAEHYIRLIEDFPRFREAELVYQRLAECYTQSKRIREAISEYENLIKAFPDSPNRRKVRLQIADLYYDNDKSQSLMEYQKVLRDAPYDDLSEKAYLRIGGIRFIRNEYEQAVPAYQAVAEKSKDPGIKRDARDHLSYCLESSGNYDQAVKILEETEPDPSRPDYLAGRIKGIRERQKTRKLIQPESLGEGR